MYLNQHVFLTDDEQRSWRLQHEAIERADLSVGSGFLLLQVHHVAETLDGILQGQVQLLVGPPELLPLRQAGPVAVRQCLPLP